jgi:hypothetical protein
VHGRRRTGSTAAVAPSLNGSKAACANASVAWCQPTAGAGLVVYHVAVVHHLKVGQPLLLHLFQRPVHALLALGGRGGR